MSPPGRADAIPGIGGFDIVDSVRVIDTDEDDSTITTYDAAGTQLAQIPSGEFTGECGALDVAPAGRRLIVTENDVTQPARGIDPQLESLSLSAWDAATGARVWNTDIFAPTDETETGAGGWSSPATPNTTCTWPQPGILPIYSVDASPYSGVGTDGSYLAAFQGATVDGYSLPHAQPLRRYPAQNGDILVATTARTVIVARGSLDKRLFGVDPATGKDRWSVPDAVVCGITETQLLVGVNNQLAVIDVATGRQLSYGPATDLVPNSDCPRVLPGGITVVDDGQNLSVIQILAP